MFIRLFFLIAAVLVLNYGCEEKIYPDLTINRYSTFTDNRDQKIYRTVTIGSQTWMAENLAFIPFISNPEYEGVWVYNFYDTTIAEARISQYYILYGCLYNWEIARQACPTGWHLSTDEEWMELTDFVRNDGHINCEGVALKSSVGWMNGDGSDNYGFKALPGGTRNPYGDFYYEGGRTLYWTDTPENDSYSWTYDLVHTTTIIRRYTENVTNGFSVRCVKD
jgi:uncharacterized protein (TIGR02145 family)